MIDGLDPDALRRLERSRPSAAGWTALCLVTLRDNASRSSRTAEPIIGSYRVDGSTLRFIARFPLDQPHYRVFIDSALVNSISSGPLVVDIHSEHPVLRNTPPTVVTAVFPSAPVLPENLLRLYIHFSAPMSRGQAYRRVRLLDAAGKPVADPFLELDEELWSRDGCRLTIFFDPGRIKRGLKPREDIGPALEQGHSYTLVIDRGWTDATGRSLDGEFKRQFAVGPPDNASPDPSRWVIRAPAAGTREPLEIHFPEPLDNALARRLITVEDQSARNVPGEVRLAAAETRWSFIPEDRWGAGGYRLLVGTELEDVAGNAIDRPFEVDENRPISRRIESRKARLPFLIKPLPR